MRCLSFYMAYYQVFFEPVHLPGRLNEATDVLSHNNLSLFVKLTPKAQQQASPIPDPLIQALIRTIPDWTSPAWTATLLSTLDKD